MFSEQKVLFLQAVQNGDYHQMEQTYGPLDDIPSNIIVEISTYDSKAIDNFIAIYYSDDTLYQLAYELINQYRVGHDVLIRRIIEKSSPPFQERLITLIETGEHQDILTPEFRARIGSKQNAHSPQDQMSVEQLIELLGQAIDQENQPLINHLATSGIFNNSQLIKPILTQALYRKIRPKYEGGEVDSADWVRWLVQNGA